MLLYWDYELVADDLLWFIFYLCKKELLFFNRQELLEKAKDRYNKCGIKQKPAEYYIVNKGVLKENAKNKYRNLSEEEKEAKREYVKKDIEIWQKTKRILKLKEN